MRPTSTSKPVAWTPLFRESDAGPLRRALASISSALTWHDLVRFCGPTVSRGAAGIGVFFSYLAIAERDVRSASHASAWFSRAFENQDTFQEPSRRLACFGGSTGIAWAQHHLGSRGIRLGEDTGPTVDDFLLDYTQSQPWHGAYDLVSGLVGHGVYALERIAEPFGHLLLEQVIGRLSETCVARHNGGATWSTPPHLGGLSPTAASSDEGVNLGLAHGVPGVIALLAQACRAGVAPGKARPLLDDAVKWLLAQRNPEGSESCFGTRASLDERRPGRPRSRLAWCYGDLGLSAALLWAAVSVGEPTWEREALDVAHHAAARPVDRSGVVDAGLCHGAAGNGHIFNRLYQATGDPVFSDAARRWFRRTMDFYRPGQGVGGFQAWRNGGGPGGAGQWQYLPGLLEGAAGIGLALLAAISPIEPEWDRLLLVAIPPRPVGGRAV